jgi:hypothetical protein
MMLMLDPDFADTAQERIRQARAYRKLEEKFAPYGAAMVDKLCSLGDLLDKAGGGVRGIPAAQTADEIGRAPVHEAAETAWKCAELMGWTGKVFDSLLPDSEDDR